MTTSKAYWKQREEEALKANLQTEAEYDKELQRIYADMQDEIQKEIESFYVRYAGKEGISIADAKKRVSSLEIEEYERKAEKYVKQAAADRERYGYTVADGEYFSDQANEEMRLYNITMKVNRLELLKAKIGQELLHGFDKVEQVNDKALNDRAIEELERQAGMLGKTLSDNAKSARAIVGASFKNATYSERIWANQSLLKNELNSLLTTGLIQGKNPRELARELRKVIDASRYNSERLLTTELARVQTEAQKLSFERNGFDQYTFVACGDFKVCDVCKAIDGKHFDVKKMMPGENAPPMHPFADAQLLHI